MEARFVFGAEYSWMFLECAQRCLERMPGRCWKLSCWARMPNQCSVRGVGPTCLFSVKHEVVGPTSVLNTVCRHVYLINIKNGGLGTELLNTDVLGTEVLGHCWARMCRGEGVRYMVLGQGLLATHVCSVLGKRGWGRRCCVLRCWARMCALYWYGVFGHGGVGTDMLGTELLGT